MSERHRNPQPTLSLPDRPGVLLLALVTMSCGAEESMMPVDEDVAAILVGAGDIAVCGTDHDEATANLIDSMPGIVFTAGDNAYNDGTAAEFADCYGPSWGRHTLRTRPSAGNHDYRTQDATGYFEYFGARAGNPTEGYYSYEWGAWHVVVLNSNIERSVGSPQHQWLVADLAAATSRCTIAYWHHPRFSSGEHGGDDSVQLFWDELYATGADVVVNGHDHDYERFAPQAPDGAADPSSGMREFVVGTGGKSLRDFSTIADNSEVRDSKTFGVLKLALFAIRYEWEFVPVAGSSFRDTGTADCH